jgi:hypothetical protein
MDCYHLYFQNCLSNFEASLREIYSASVELLCNDIGYNKGARNYLIIR